jgi:crotonobetainyl-CoA:carnitine CoA-transferase CaiB-like acyl-CoA transferase
MAPHAIYPTREPDGWVAIACRDDEDWSAFGGICAESWAQDPGFATVAGRLGRQEELDGLVAGWTSTRERDQVAGELRAVGVPAAPVAMSEDRIDHDPDNAAWGMFPVAHHPEMGDVRVDGLPVHLSETDWHISRGAPLLGQHNREVFCDLVGLSDDEFRALQDGSVL